MTTTRSTSPSSASPMIVKYTQQECNGVQAHNLNRHCIGYILRGQKYIHYGDQRYLVNQGDVFYLGVGTHYTERIPEAGRNFEQISFYYTSEQLARMLSQLSMNYRLDIRIDHRCPKCTTQAHVAAPAWHTLKTFFGSINQYLREGAFTDETVETLKINELVYLILAHPDGCLKSKILSNSDMSKENFEQIVMGHIFEDILIEELAAKCNRSLTSFKKEFRRLFHEPPHQWFIRQRLMRARLLLVSTDQSIAQVGQACTFPNTSHFIKLFKKEYDQTPAQYRRQYTRSIQAASSPKEPPLFVPPAEGKISEEKTDPATKGPVYPLMDI